MQLQLKCKLKDCSYCRPTKHVYKYNRHDAELSEKALRIYWDRVKDKPADFFIKTDRIEGLKYE